MHVCRDYGVKGLVDILLLCFEAKGSMNKPYCPYVRLALCCVARVLSGSCVLCNSELQMISPGNWELEIVGRNKYLFLFDFGKRS